MLRNMRIRDTWEGLKKAWDKTWLEDKWEKEWNNGQIWRDCAEKTKVFAAAVFALQ